MEIIGEATELFKALAKFQSELEPVAFDGVNPHFKSKYATLKAIREAVFPILSKHGLVVVQAVEGDGARVVVETRLVHSSGAMLKTELSVSPTKNDPQGMGSAATYARRYALTGLLGVVGEDDDDGNAASVPFGEVAVNKSGRWVNTK